MTNYGDPIIVKVEDDPYKQIFIYRYPLNYDNTDKIYLEFDNTGKLIGKDGKMISSLKTIITGCKAKEKRSYRVTIKSHE